MLSVSAGGSIVGTYFAATGAVKTSAVASPPLTCDSARRAYFYLDTSYLPNRVYFCIQLDSVPTYAWKYVTLN